MMKLASGTHLSFLFFCMLITSQSHGKVTILACEPEWYALAQEIGKDYIRGDSATTAFQDPHHIEARPSLIAKARKADLLFCTGSELEIGWLPLLLRQSGNPKIQTGKAGNFMASEVVTKLEVPNVLDRGLGDVHAGGNPHVHLNPYHVLTIAEELTLRFCAIDQNNCEQYKTNFADFSTRWKTDLAQWEARAVVLKGKQVIVHHGSLNYLFHWLGIEIIADIEPKPGLPPSSAHLAKLLTTIQKARPDMIAIAAYQDDKGARWLEKRSKLPVAVLPFTVGGNDESQTLFALYDSTINLLLEASRHDG